MLVTALDFSILRAFIACFSGCFRLRRLVLMPSDFHRALPPDQGFAPFFEFDPAFGPFRRAKIRLEMNLNPISNLEKMTNGHAGSPRFPGKREWAKSPAEI